MIRKRENLPPKAARLLSAICIGLLFAGCGTPAGLGITATTVPPGPDDGGEGEANQAPRIFRIGIVGAEALFIAKKPAASREASADSNDTALYMVTDSGTIDEITYEGEAQETIEPGIAPSGIFPVNDEYFILQFDSTEAQNGLNPNASSYLCRKSDGATFILNDGDASFSANSNVGNPHLRCVWDYLNGRSIQTDREGDIYYVGYGIRSGAFFSERLIKIDISDPERITSTFHSAAQNEQVRAFQVSADGHTLYSFQSQPGLASGMRIRSNSGALKNLPGIDTAFWTGSDGAFYYNVLPAGQSQGGIHRVTADAAGALTDTVVQTPGISITLAPWMVYLLSTADRILLVNTYGDVILAETPDGQRRILFTRTFNTLRAAGASEKYFYLAANDAESEPSVYRIDPETTVVTPMLPRGKYEVYHMAVGRDDAINFNALRMSDGADVIGEISPDGTVTIISETTDSREMIVLVRM